MKRIVFAISLFLLSGCEIRHAPTGKPVFVVEAGTSVVVGKNKHTDYCYDSDYDYCCVYYENYANYEVCKTTECLDYHTDEWYFESEQCWY